MPPSPPTPLLRCGRSSPPAPLPQRGRGVCWLVDSVSLTDAGAESPLRREPPPSSASRGGAAGGQGKVRGIIPPSSPLVEAAGGRRKVRGIIPPSSPAAWERKGARGEGAGRPHPRPPLPRYGRGVIWLVNSVSLTDASAESPLRREPPPSSASRGGAAGGRGKVWAARRAPQHRL